MSVRGTATAATIWNAGAIGIAIAYAMEEIAVVLAVMNFLLLLVLTPLEHKRRSDDAGNHDNS